MQATAKKKVDNKARGDARFFKYGIKNRIKKYKSLLKKLRKP